MTPELRSDDPADAAALAESVRQINDTGFCDSPSCTWCPSRKPPADTRDQIIADMRETLARVEALVKQIKRQVSRDEAADAIGTLSRDGVGR